MLMRNRIVLLVVFCLAYVAACAGQTQETEAQTLRQILSELRAIHQDMRVTETTQLLVAELEMQQAVVNRATEAADNARAKLNGVRVDEKRAADDLEHIEEKVEKEKDKQVQLDFSGDLDRDKSNLAALKAADRDLSSTLQDLEQRLQTAQDKLASIDAELSTAISRLSPSAKESGPR
jgi:chromosome segregation ATPase